MNREIKEAEANGKSLTFKGTSAYKVTKARVERYVREGKYWYAVAREFGLVAFLLPRASNPSRLTLEHFGQHYKLLRGANLHDILESAGLNRSLEKDVE
jgi:hypothetical protein